MAKRTSIPPKVRWSVLARDGFRCRYCGARGGDAVLVVDHSDPVANGGSNEEWNLITSCETCNQGKGDSRSTIIADLEYRIDTLADVLAWLDAAWATAAGVDWTPGEYTLLHLIAVSWSYAEAEEALREVGERLRGGVLRPGLSELDIRNLVTGYAEFISDIRHHARCYGYEVTPEMLVHDRAEFWEKPEWNLGMVAKG